MFFGFDNSDEPSTACSIIVNLANIVIKIVVKVVKISSPNASIVSVFQISFFSIYLQLDRLAVDHLHPSHHVLENESHLFIQRISSFFSKRNKAKM